MINKYSVLTLLALMTGVVPAVAGDKTSPANPPADQVAPAAPAASPAAATAPAAETKRQTEAKPEKATEEPKEKPKTKASQQEINIWPRSPGSSLFKHVRLGQLARARRRLAFV